MHVLATAGHVDHGKSTLLRLLTGMEPDRWAQERERGMTIDLGFAWTTIGEQVLAFVDVPGHERFVPNMLAGVGPVPAVLFVVAADEGWQPQSTEHLDALHALGVRHGLLVVTRCDLADPTAATEQARRRLRDSALGELPAVHVSGRTGAGLGRLRAALCALAGRLPAPDSAAAVRLWIDRAFTIRGAGTVVTGTLAAGSLRTGDRLRLHPGGQDVAVRALHSLGEPVERTSAVARVAVNLRGVPLEQVRRGHALLTPGTWLGSDLFDVRLCDRLAADLPRQLVLHLGSAAVAVRVRPLGADTARLSLREPLPVRIGDRVLLRDPGAHDVAGGAVLLDVRPRPLRRRGAARERARELAGMDGVADGAGELRRRRMVRGEQLRAMGAQVPAGAPEAAGWVLDPGHRDELAERLVRLLDEHREREPLADGLPAEAARRALALPDAALLEVLLRAGPAREIRTGGGRLRVGTAPWPPEIAAALERLRGRLADAPFAAPTAAELAELGLGSEPLAAAVRAGELLRLAPGVVLLPGAERRALEVLRGLPEPFTLSAARQALGTSRRVAVPLLELLAREGRTELLPDGTHRALPSTHD
ncbi:selenocysteine-specific translation elongation factor [Saccharopolyspora gloriosae]|uniref:Selenocysteine-specific elongation factor n=1 Tax=Saccharopolyspora gloriosae TaxID=455344 RepID=A0A840NEX6_9PSEU|nr:selenocysteine-specific translation elongation factor [Saccharopolyspora gloriosae]MBB5069531.1 selenocysteine-specific elongation factor [Saccharopolyspora gloriosae]